MERWKKHLHIVIIFILIASLLSPASAAKAQPLEEPLLSLTTDIGDIDLSDSKEQGNPIESVNEIDVDNPIDVGGLTEQEKAQQFDGETELDRATDVTLFMEASPFEISDIQLNKEEPLLLLKEETYLLAVTNLTTDDSATVTWTSSKPNIATVDGDGLVTGIAIGDAEITVTIGAVSKTIKVYVIPEAVKEIIDLVIALPDELEPTETIYQQLLTIRQKETKLQTSIRNIFDTTPYPKLLRQKEAEFTINYMSDPVNATPSVEDITTLDENLSAKLEKIRKVYTSFFSISGRYQPTDTTLQALDHELAAKEVKYAILAIDALPKIEDLTSETDIKGLLDLARKKYDGITSVRPTPPLLPTLPPGNESFKVDVTNRQELFDKEVKYVELLIEAVDINSPLAKDQLKAASDAYANLKKLKDASNKGLHTNVSNYNDLLNKEKVLNAEDDINQVIAKIAALPSEEMLIWADYLKIFEAQQAFDQLLAIHKESVTNYDKLEALQKRLLQLQPSTIDTYNDVAEYLAKNLNNPGYEDEWTILTLARGDINLDKYATYYNQYYSNIVDHVKATNGEIGKQATDWARVIIALTAIGKDPRNVAGYNLVEKLSDLSFATSPSVNSTIFSLIALDTWGFELPETATTTRDKLIQNILSKEIKNGGGFAWSGNDPDPDMTGMVLQALAPYQSNPQVKAVIDRSIATLEAIQTANGGYKSGGSENAESAAQVVTALAALGIDANKDKRFDKVIPNIMKYSSGDGGFKHVLNLPGANDMATVQVGYTLAGYNRLLNNQTALYNMSDTKPNNNGNNLGDSNSGNVGEEPPSPNSKEGKTQTVFTAEDIKQYAQNNVKTIVIQDTQGTKLEIPTSALSSIRLGADEKIATAVTVQAEGKQIDVNLSIETADGTTKAISTGKAYAKITLPASDVTPNTVVLQSVNGEYKAVPHKIVDGEIIILTKTSGTFVVMEETVTFKDISQTFSKEEIEFLASRHIIKGVNADEFEPNKPITRAQFAVIISRALGLQTSDENTFSDTKGQWYEQDVQALFEAGITTGKTADTFDPEANITRQQAAAFMARVLAYVDFQAQASTEANFKDANAIGSEFKQSIELLNSLNIMTGKADGTFDPYSSLTRAQMAKILKRTLNIAELM